MAWSMGLLGASVPAAAGAFDLLETTILTSSASSVTFSGLDAYSDYKHLQIRALVKSYTGGTGREDLYIRFNSVGSSQYASHDIQGNGSAVREGASTNDTEIIIPDSVPRGSDGTSGNFSALVLDILDYSSTNKNTTLRGFGGMSGDETRIGLYSGLFLYQDAITSMTFTIENSESFISSTRFSLYGVK